MDKELRTKNVEYNSSSEYRYIEHVLQPQDTLAGIALKYGSNVGEIKRINKIWSTTQDTLFLKKKLIIPIKEEEDCGEGSSSGVSSLDEDNSSGDDYQQKKDMIKAKNIDFFSEFNSKSNYNLNNVLNNKPLPSSDDDNWKSVPISILSLSPVVNALDHKTQLSFTLIDEELNPL